MNPYLRRLNSFSPVEIAQGLPPGGAPGFPLEAIQGTLSPEQLKQEGMSAPPPGFSGGMPPGLGGPMSSGPAATYTTDIPLKAGYRNIYGTNIGIGYEPNTGAIKGNATIPIGAAEKGYRLGVEGSYTPGIMDPTGATPPAAFSGMLRFSKTNPVDPAIYSQPGKEKYSIELGVDGVPRRVNTGPGKADPSLFQGLLNGR